jgi:diguanylate cyclase (GGDEF)-like protein/PAS domain S-box-containing protein
MAHLGVRLRPTTQIAVALPPSPAGSPLRALLGGAARDGAGRLWAALIAYASVYCLWRVLMSPPGAGTMLQNRVAFALPGVAAITLAWLASRVAGLERGPRRAWRLLALAFLAVEAGNLIWLSETFHPPHGVSIANAAWLAYYPLLLGGVLSFPRIARTRPERLQFWMDAGSVVCGGTMLVIYLVGVPLSPTLPLFEAAVTAAYPVGDVGVLLAVALLSLRQQREPARISYLLLTAALCLELAGDIAWGSLSLTGGQPNGIFSDLTYMSSWVLRGSAALAYIRATSRPAPHTEALARVVPSGANLLPYGSALLGYTALFLALAVADVGTLRLLAAGAAVLTALALVSQWLTARDNLRLQTEQAEQRSESRFRTLVQNSSDLIAVIDEHGDVRYVAPSAEGILERPVDRLPGRPFADLVHPDDAPRARAFLAHAALAPGVSSPAELRVGEPGRWIAMEALATNLLSDPGIGGIVLTLRDIRERKALEEQLMHRALHDSLTGLANRALFADRLRRARQLALHERRSFAVLVMDLDDFKRVNDGLGHAAGDQALVEIAHRLRQVVRSTDTAARLGGDEFAVLIEGADEELARRTAEALLTVAAAPLAIGTRELRLGGSVGVAISTPELTDDEVLRQADLALYHAKESGKARMALFAPGMQSEMLRRHHLESELRESIERGELHLLYQPLFSLRSGRIAGAEALVRWRHPVRGLVPPSDFIDLAESSGLIESLGRWVVHQACHQAALWNGNGGRPFHVGVNLSVRQLHDPGVVDEVRHALAESGLPADRLVCEITETLLALDPLAAAARLHDLKGAGVRLALDDFGTGYSSLGRLRDLPIDILKVDGVFARDLSTPQGSLLAGAIVELGKAVGLLVVAEGVETSEQVAALRALRCDLAQGFHLGRPMEAEELGRMLTRQALA